MKTAQTAEVSAKTGADPASKNEKAAPAQPPSTVSTYQPPGPVQAYGQPPGGPAYQAYPPVPSYQNPGYQPQQQPQTVIVQPEEKKGRFGKVGGRVSVLSSCRSCAATDARPGAELRRL